MEINAQTKLRDILDAYPWLPETLVKMDGRFRIINNPVGRMLIRTATFGDACKKAGYPVEEAMAEFKKLIAAHEAEGT